MGDGEIEYIGNNKDICYFPDQLLGEGSLGTEVFRGLFQKREVAIKRIKKSQAQFVEREVKVLCSGNTLFKYVVFCFWTSFLLPEDTKGKNHYLVLELCAGTLDDYISGRYKGPMPSDLEVLRQVCWGLKWIHDRQIAHKDLRPQNILISVPDSNREVNLKIADFGLSREVPAKEITNTNTKGAQGWISAEIMGDERLDYYKADIFSLGCVFHYFLAREGEPHPKGCHPFGDTLLMRQVNIANVKRHISENLSYTMRYLIESMIDHDPGNRPTINKVLKHPALWSADKIIQFLGSVSNVLEPVRKKPGRHLDLENLAGNMEINADDILGGDFRHRLTSAVNQDINNRANKQKNPDYGTKVLNLLRLVRNLRPDGHYSELEQAVKDELGDPKQGFHDYFMGRFPKLLIHVWKVMKPASNMRELEEFYMPVQVNEMDLQPTRRTPDGPISRETEPAQDIRVSVSELSKSEVPFTIERTVRIMKGSVQIVAHDPARPGSFAVAMEDSSIHVYDVDKGLVRIRSPVETQKMGQRTNVVLVWNETGYFLAAVRTNEQVLLWEWNREVLSEKEIELSTCVRSIQWSHTDTGDVLQIVGHDRFVALNTSGEVIREFPFNGDSVNFCDWVGSSRFIAVVGPSREKQHLVMYEVQLGNADEILKLMGETSEFTETVNPIKCHPNGNLVAFGFRKGIVKFWDVRKSTNALPELRGEDYTVCKVDCLEWISENSQDLVMLASFNDFVITFWKFDKNWIKIWMASVGRSVMNMKHLISKGKLCLISYKGVSVINAFPKGTDEVSKEAETGSIICDFSIDQSEDSVKILLGQKDGSVKVLQLNC